MAWTSRLTYASLAIALVSAGAGVVLMNIPHDPPAAKALVPPPEAPVAATPKTIMTPVAIGRGDTLGDLLSQNGMDTEAAAQIIAAINDKFSVRKLRAGSEMMLTRYETGDLHQIDYTIDSDRQLRVLNEDGVITASIVEIPATVRTVNVCGTVDGSLFESMQAAGEQSELAIRFAEIFAWDLDFYRDPQPGDRFCALVEKKEYENGQAPSYVRILAATYDNAGKAYDAYLYPGAKGEQAYYSADGKSLKAAFLRSPIKFEARISSRFSKRRFHPVLRRYRPHLGTDYAVPTGTPVQSIAAGQVVYSAYQRGSGNLVRVKHANGYETYYLHLSRRLVRVGQRIEQGQRIGLSGATGLASGPHLDFRIRRNGTFLNFETLRLPRTAQLTAQQLARFSTVRDEYRQLMLGKPDAILAQAGEPVAPGALVD
jgi:murein DD-endopeptidase MepM/ murein hydrolase activator NlpD